MGALITVRQALDIGAFGKNIAGTERRITGRECEPLDSLLKAPLAPLR